MDVVLYQNHIPSKWLIRDSFLDRNPNISYLVSSNGESVLIDASGEKVERRAQQAKSWMWSEISESLIAALRHDPKAKQRIDGLEQAVIAGSTAPTLAAAELIEIFLGKE